MNNEDIALLKYNELKNNFISKYRAYDLSTYQMVYQTGMITINSFKSEVSSFSREMLKYRNGVAILYSDTKNDRMARLKKEEDL